jgi:hypothetical protein
MFQIQRALCIWDAKSYDFIFHRMVQHLTKGNGERCWQLVDLLLPFCYVSLEYLQQMLYIWGSSDKTWIHPMWLFGLKKYKIISYVWNWMMKNIHKLLNFLILLFFHCIVIFAATTWIIWDFELSGNAKRNVSV